VRLGTDLRWLYAFARTARLMAWLAPDVAWRGGGAGWWPGNFVYRRPFMNITNPIILCGFTSSGKTTIGELLAARLGVAFYDTDHMLIEQNHMTIKEIFAKGGEPLFRDMEHQIAKQVCSLGPSVVSTGGGMLTFERNGEILSKNGTILYIDRSFEDCYESLSLHPDRPLFKNHTREEILETYNSRTAMYRRYASAVIKNDSTPEDAVHSICEYLAQRQA